MQQIISARAVPMVVRLCRGCSSADVGWISALLQTRTRVQHCENPSQNNWSDPIPVTQITIPFNLGLVLQTCTSLRRLYLLNVTVRFSMQFGTAHSRNSFEIKRDFFLVGFLNTEIIQIQPYFSLGQHCILIVRLLRPRGKHNQE